jgi:hypothetical protein
MLKWLQQAKGGQSGIKDEPLSSSKEEGKENNITMKEVTATNADAQSMQMNKEDMFLKLPNSRKRKRHTPHSPKQVVEDGGDFPKIGAKEGGNSRKKEVEEGEDDGFAVKHMDHDWYAMLKEELQKPYYRKLSDFLRNEIASKKTIFPPGIPSSVSECQFWLTLTHFLVCKLKVILTPRY